MGLAPRTFVSQMECRAGRHIVYQEHGENDHRYYTPPDIGKLKCDARLDSNDLWRKRYCTSRQAMPYSMLFDAHVGDTLMLCSHTLMEIGPI